jgi:dolichol kinase
MALILTILVVLLLLVASEIWWRKRRPHDEFSRKFIHVTVGSFAATWPFFLSWDQILGLSAAFLVGVLFSQYLNIFQAIHAVERPTWGEVCFALAVGVLALVTRNPAIYLVALLHMGLADGVAAIVGTIYGKSNTYMVFTHVKSIAGTLAFLAISLTLLIAYATVAPIPINAGIIVVLALLATALENVAIKGLDNLLVPLVVAAALTLVS